LNPWNFFAELMRRNVYEGRDCLCRHGLALNLGRNTALFEITSVLVRLDHIARFVINSNHSIMRPAEELGVSDCVAGCVADAADDVIELLRNHRGSSQQSGLQLGLRCAWPLPTESD
jgi:hypothetical protein